MELGPGHKDPLLDRLRLLKVEHPPETVPVGSQT